MRIVLLGPPGSGKGTRARIISELYEVLVISTGDILREAANKSNERGEKIREFLDKGNLVPSEIVNDLVKERLESSDTEKGYVLDGYPRNEEQAKALGSILEERGEKLDHVLYVDIDDEAIIERLSKRRSCPRCGAVYHLRYNPPRKDMLCDECGAALIQRGDDEAEVIKNRLKVYREKTEPLLKRYKKRCLVRKISGDVDIDQLPQIIKKTLS